MKYIVHVVDRSSQHLKTDGEETIVVHGFTEYGEKRPCQISSTDAFYIVEAKDPSDAAITIANNLTVLDENGQDKPLSVVLADTTRLNEKPENSDQNVNYFGAEVKDADSQYLDHDLYEIEESMAFGEIFHVSFKIKRTKNINGNPENNKIWYELHKMDFFIIEEGELIRIN